MLIKNPIRHYPTYTAKVFYSNGNVLGQSSTAEAEMITFPGEKEDILAIVLVGLDEGNHPITAKMWVDGLWRVYDEELLNQLTCLRQEEEEKVEEEEKEKGEEEEKGEEKGEDKEEEVLSAVPFSSRLHEYICAEVPVRKESSPCFGH